MEAYKIVDFGGASIDVGTKQTISGIYADALAALNLQAPIRPINLFQGTTTKTPIAPGYCAAVAGTSSAVVVYLGMNLKATIGTDNGVTIAEVVSTS